jgi:hypothetical protein
MISTEQGGDSTAVVIEARRQRDTNSLLAILSAIARASAASLDVRMMIAVRLAGKRT